MGTHSNPREGTNFIGVLLWTWTIKFLKVGYQKVLRKEDLYDPLKFDRSNCLGDKLERYWNEDSQKALKYKRSPSLTRTLFRSFLWEILLFGLLECITQLFLRMSTPIMLGQLLSYFREDDGIDRNQALMYAAGVCLSLIAYIILFSFRVYKYCHIGGRMRIAVCSMIYRKALRLNLVTSNDTTSGKIVNLLANDVNRFEQMVHFMHYLWLAPLSACVIGYYLWNEAGYSGLFGLPIIFSNLPIQLYVGKLSAQIRLKTTRKTDERVGLLNELISGVQVIKMYAWEKPFCKILAHIRKLEIIEVRRASWIQGGLNALWLCMPRTALYCTLVGMILSGKPPATEKIFIFFSFYWLLAELMGFMFARGVSEVAQGLVTIKRLEEILVTREFQDSKNSAPPMNMIVSKRISKAGIIAIENDTGVCGNQDISIELYNLTAKWDESSAENTLNNVNLKIKRSKLYVMIGGVGQGKSSLVSSILGEITISKGHIDIHGSISYASQEAWIFGATVRQNILFGQPYDAQRYEDVVKVCALLKDFDQFLQGDQTILGERGSSLSGGQKARINLARSVYRQSDIYIFDDPLSAVDAHVGQHLFEKCLQGYLSGKTRILVTHQVQYVRKADIIMLLEHGTLSEFEDYRDVLQARPEYDKLLVSNSTPEANNEFIITERSDKRDLTGSDNQIGIVTDILYDEAEDGGNDMKLSNSLEKTSKGTITGSIYINYLKIGNSWCFILTVFIFNILTLCAITFYDLFYSRMIETEEKRYKDYLKQKLNSSFDTPENDGEFDIEPAYYSIYIYTAITLLISLSGVVGIMISYVMCLNSSQNLHNKAFNSLIRTSMQFFSVNPSGRIINRFSKDIGCIDNLLPISLDDTILSVMISLSALIIVCFINPIFLIPLLVIIGIVSIITKVYSSASKNLRRLEGMTRSSVFTHFNSTMNGLMTIRASGAQKLLIHEFDKFQDDHSSAWYMSIASAAAFEFYIGILCSVFTIILTFGVVIAKDYGASEVGLAITSVTALTSMLPFAFLQISDIINHMMSVERISEYTYLQPEDNSNHTMEDNRRVDAISLTPSNWPKGSISFKHVSLKYSENAAYVLKDLNFAINPMEKIGVIGRTGAGKSSLISALFRLTNFEGSIEIDGIDIKSINLEYLRRNIAIIPQEPVLFSGNLRVNLDPFNEFSDDALWSALEEVELKEFVMKQVNGLDSMVVDKGANFSIGQRQLICLARAILRNNRILVLDEATANVDPYTDRLIQKTIREKFMECTVITVAHRLNTIIDSDKVLVMDDGYLIEFDHPYLLLQNRERKFTDLVDKSGMRDNLIKNAEESYKEKYLRQTSAI